MKNKIIITVFMVMVFCLSSISWAEDNTPVSGGKDFKKEVLSQEKITTARINVAKKAAGFIGGVFAGYVFHELGHGGAALIEGVTPRMSGGVIKWNSSPAASRIIGLGGFGAQFLSDEIILGVDAIPKNNSFVLGWLAYNTLNTVSYIVADSVIDGGHRDFKVLRDNGMNTDIVKIVLLAHMALSVYRLYNNPQFMPYVGVTKNEVVVGLTWRW